MSGWQVITGDALEGFRVVLVERDTEMAEFARRRIGGPLFANETA